MQKEKKPFSLMTFIGPHRAGFITAIVLAVLSVASGIVPYGTTAVENIIWRLRQKLEDDPKHPVYIKTVIRSGYKIELPR